MDGLKESFINAFRGIYTAIKEERNLKIHLFIALSVLVLASFFQVNRIELVILLSMIIIVIALELMNTAIERVLDIIHPERNIKVGKIKDIAAGSVLMAAIIAAIVGLIILMPYIYESLSR